MTGPRLVVLDASAVLAVLQGEAGAEVAEPVFQGARISTVNFSEVLAKTAAKGRPIHEVARGLVDAGLEVLEFTSADAQLAATLFVPSRSIGLSFADRACLAVAKRLGAVAYTADRRWRDIRKLQAMTSELTGIDVRLVRHDGSE